MNKWIIGLALFMLCSCKNEEQTAEDESSFFPIKSYIQSQVAHIDTSIYNIRKITTINNQSDTTFIKREEFRALAKDFLDIPDISQRKWRDDYNETKIFDETLNSAILTYTPKDLEDAEIRRQEVIIHPDAAEGEQVKTIFIEQSIEKGTSTIQKKMLWQVDKWFRIVTITQKLNEPEKVETLQVIWAL